VADCCYTVDITIVRVKFAERWPYDLVVLLLLSADKRHWFYCKRKALH